MTTPTMSSSVRAHPEDALLPDTRVSTPEPSQRQAVHEELARGDIADVELPVSMSGFVRHLFANRHFPGGVAVVKLWGSGKRFILAEDTPGIRRHIRRPTMVDRGTMAHVERDTVDTTVNTEEHEFGVEPEEEELLRAERAALGAATMEENITAGEADAVGGADPENEGETVTRSANDAADPLPEVGPAVFKVSNKNRKREKKRAERKEREALLERNGGEGSNVERGPRKSNTWVTDSEGEAATSPPRPRKRLAVEIPPMKTSAFPQGTGSDDAEVRDGSGIQGQREGRVRRNIVESSPDSTPGAGDAIDPWFARHTVLGMTDKLKLQIKQNAMAIGTPKAIADVNVLLSSWSNRSRLAVEITSVPVHLADAPATVMDIYTVYNDLNRAHKQAQYLAVYHRFKLYYLNELYQGLDIRAMVRTKVTTQNMQAQKKACLLDWLHPELQDLPDDDDKKTKARSILTDRLAWGFRWWEVKRVFDEAMFLKIPADVSNHWVQKKLKKEEFYVFLAAIRHFNPDALKVQQGEGEWAQRLMRSVPLLGPVDRTDPEPGWGSQTVVPATQYLLKGLEDVGSSADS